MIPIQLNVNPANHEKLDEWRNACLWKSFDDRELEYFIRDIQKCTIKSGFVLVYDDDGSFKSIPFRAKKIMDPKKEEVVIRVKHLRKNQGMTFDEKIEMLNRFVAENNREPSNDDVVDGFNLGKFHTSLKKNRDKYQFFLDHIGKLDEMDIEVEEDDKEPEIADDSNEKPAHEEKQDKEEKKVFNSDNISEDLSDSDDKDYVIDPLPKPVKEEQKEEAKPVEAPKEDDKKEKKNKKASKKIKRTESTTQLP